MPPHALPTPSSSVRLSLLDGGSFIADTNKLHAGVPNEKFRMYNWAFCISHGDEHVLWDLGLTDDRSLYTPWVNKYMLDYVNPSAPRRSIVQQLAERGISSTEIKTIIFSHAHWDHAHPPTSFPHSTSLFGPTTLLSCSPGHLSHPTSQWDGRFFDPSHATERCAELPGPWVPFGPFEQAMDFFGDGSFWVIQAPGHMAGNLCAVCRVGGEWVVLGSDCCHSRAILNGTHDIAQFSAPHREGTMMSLHADIEAARETIKKIRVLEREFGAHVALAHDAEWMREGTDEVLMGLLDGEMRGAARGRILRGERA